MNNIIEKNKKLIAFLISFSFVVLIFSNKIMADKSGVGGLTGTGSSKTVEEKEGDTESLGDDLDKEGDIESLDEDLDIINKYKDLISVVISKEDLEEEHVNKILEKFNDIDNIKKQYLNNDMQADEFNDIADGMYTLGWNLRIARIRDCYNKLIKYTDEEQIEVLKGFSNEDIEKFWALPDTIYDLEYESLDEMLNICEKIFEKMEAYKEEAAKKEVDKEKAAKEEAAKKEVDKEKAAKEEAAKKEADKEKAAKEEAAKKEADKEKAAKEEAAKEEAAKKEVDKEKAAKEEAAKKEADKEKAAKEEAAKEEAAKKEVDKEKAAKERKKRELEAEKLQPYIEEFNKKENQEVINQLPSEQKDNINKYKEYLKTLKQEYIEEKKTENDLKGELDKCKALVGEMIKKKAEIEKNKRADKANNELQPYIDNLNTNKDIIDQLSEDMKKEVYNYINNCELIKQEYIAGNKKEEFNNILNRCKVISEEINKKKAEIEEKKKRENKANKELQPYIEEFNKEENQEAINQLSYESRKMIINNLGTIKAEYIAGNKNEEEFNNILDRCKVISEEINKKKAEIEKRKKIENKAEELQPYIEEFNKEENQEAINQLSYESRKMIINELGTIKADYLDSKINEEEFNNILDRCKVISEEINKKKAEIEKNKRADKANNELQPYIDNLNTNKEIIDQLSEDMKKEAYSCINTCESIKADYIAGNKNEEEFNNILNRCKVISEEINKKKAEIEERKKRENKAEKLQPYIEEFKKEENKGIIDQLSYESKKMIIDNLGTIKADYLDSKINEEEFNNILNRCEVISGEIIKKRNEIERNKRADKANKELQPYIDNFNTNKEIIDQLSEGIKKEAYSYIDTWETIKQEYIEGKKTEEDFNNILNRCKVIEEEINKKKAEIEKRKKIENKAEELQPYIEEFNKEENQEAINQLSYESRKMIINELGTIKADYLDSKINEEEFNNILNKCEVILGEMIKKRNEIERKKRENKAEELQSYIDKFKKEENQEAINQLSYESRKMIKELGTIKADYLDSKINEEVFNNILDKCKVISEEINKKKAEIEERKKREPKAEELQPYIDNFNTNKEIIEKHLLEESKIIINSLETIKADYLDGKINEEDFEAILNKCKEIKERIDKIIKIKNFGFNLYFDDKEKCFMIEIIKGKKEKLTEYISMKTGDYQEIIKKLEHIESNYKKIERNKRLKKLAMSEIDNVINYLKISLSDFFTKKN